MEQAVVDAVNETRESNARIAAALEDFSTYLKAQQGRGKSTSNAENHFHFGGAFSTIATGLSVAAIIACAATWVRVEVAEASHRQLIESAAAAAANRETAWRQVWGDKVDKFINSKEAATK